MVGENEKRTWLGVSVCPAQTSCCWEMWSDWTGWHSWCHGLAAEPWDLEVGCVSRVVLSCRDSWKCLKNKAKSCKP